MIDKQKEERDNFINILNSALKEVFAYVPLDSVINVADILIENGVTVPRLVLEEIRTEVIKEFAERLKKEAGYFGRAVAVEVIEQIAKELTEDSIDGRN